MRLKSYIAGALTAAAVIVATEACSSINCQLNNTVYTTLGFYQDTTTSTAVSLLDTLTITAAGTDSILINQEYSASSVELPMSYGGDVDQLIFSCASLGADTLWIYHTNYPYYETPECGTAVFHDITRVESTHNFILTTKIVKSSVNYDGEENVMIYFK